MEIKDERCTVLNHQAAKRNIFLPMFIALFLWAFLFAQSAKAQEADSTAPLTEEQATGENLTSDSGVSDIVPADPEEAVSEEALQDFEVTIEDMGANRATILPDSPFHFFKRIGHAVTEATTFDPVAKAELKLKHANDNLAETKQMIEEKGMENVDSSVVAKSIQRYEDKFSQVRDRVEEIKQRKLENPEQIDAFLNNFVDKQIKQQKVLDEVAQDVVDVKKKQRAEGVESDVQIDSVVAMVEDTKEAVIDNFANVLAEVDDQPDALTARLSAVMDSQGGSDFKQLKNLEVLSQIQDKVPENAKEAIEKAKENAFKKFEVRLNTIPPAVRADKFKQYVKDSTVDETRLVALLDELKLSNGIPADILAKLEEAKEIAVRKFEEKLNYIDDASVEDRYFRKFSTDDGNDMIAMEEFKNRMTKDSDASKMMIQAQEKSIQEFKNKFKDSTSQDQAARFQRLSQEMLKNPNPKTMKLLSDLEKEVVQDPEKMAFIQQTQAAVKNNFETQFRREGDVFMQRMATLDPNDIGIFENMGFDPEFQAQFVRGNTKQFKDFMQGVDRPEYFDNFRDRFSQAPEYVINQIKNQDNTFQDAMMYKVRKMEEVRAEKERDVQRAAIDYQERELNFQMDRVQRQKEDEFWQKLNALPQESYDQRKQLWDQKINDQYSLAEQRFNEQKKLFDARMNNDPFCDAVCKQIQLQFMEQQMRQEKTRMGDDLVRERNKIEAQKIQEQQNNPLAGKCNTPEECNNYCQAHAGDRGCEWAVQQKNMPQACPSTSYWDFGQKQCVYLQDMSEQDMERQGIRPEEIRQPVSTVRYEFHGCKPGEYWDDGKQSCMFDPWSRPPEDFKQCPFGQKWNPSRGFCEQERRCEYKMVRDCAPGEKPTPPNPNDPCSQPSCVVKVQQCPVKNMIQCPVGQFQEITADPSGCLIYGSCQSGNAQQAQSCPQIYAPVCGMDGQTYDNDCKAKTVGIGIQYFGKCETTGFQQCPFNEFWEGRVNKCLKNTDYVPRVSGTCDFGWKWTGTYCARDSSVVGVCSTYCEPGCTNGSFCIFDNKGCAKGCSPTCSQGEYYDQFAGGCVKSTIPTTPPPTQTRTTTPQSTTCASTEFNNYSTGFACNYSKCPQGCVYGQMGCPTGCSGQGAGYCGDGFCGNGETMQSCSTDCGGNASMPCDNDGKCEPENGEGMETCPNDCKAGTSSTTGNTYQGDANSCPSFAYSRWDSSGKRYCQLNETRSCSGNYPDYLDKATYKPEWCPSEIVLSCGDGKCENGESPASCPSDCFSASISCPANQYNSFTKNKDCNFGACANGCNFDSNGCPNGCKTSGGICSKNSYNNYEGSKNCSSSLCPNGCTYNTSGCPTGCAAATPSSVCGNGACESTETSSSCPADCGSTATTPPSSGGSTVGYCGDMACSSSETAQSCPADCYTGGGSGSMTACNNNGTCEYGESSGSCPSDCGGTSGGGMVSCSAWVGTGQACNPTAGTCCSSGTCSNTSGPGTCQSSSGSYTPPANTGWCGDGTCQSYESSSSCMSDCGSASGSTMYCDNDGLCEYDRGEGPGSCPSDCSGGASMTACNNNGTCDSNESMTSCPSDCGGGTYTPPPSTTPPPTGWCGDMACNNGETAASCPSDCGQVMGAQEKRDIVSKYNPFNLLKPIASFLAGNK